MANCISGLISNMLRDYVEPLEGNQVTISIWNGDAELRNMRLKSTALINAGSPLSVNNGTIEKLKFHYPWGLRDVQPTSIKISDINIETQFIEDLKIKRIQRREKETKKEHEKNKEDNEPHNTSFLGRFFSSISDNVNKKIVSNLVVEINRFTFIVHMTTENLKQKVVIKMHFNNLRFNMQNENSFFAIDGLLFSINLDDSEQSDPRSKMKFEMNSFTTDSNQTNSDIILNQPFFLLDINEFAVADVFDTVLNSPWHQNMESNKKPPEAEKEKKSKNTFVNKYVLTGMKVNVYDKNVDLNADIEGKCDFCGLKGRLEMTKFDVYISEDKHQYPYIFHDMTIQIDKDDRDFYVTFNRFNPSLSYSDLIDLSTFYNKREKMLSFFNEKRKRIDKSDDDEEDQNSDKKKKHHHKKHHHKKHHNKKNKNNDAIEHETEESYYIDDDDDTEKRDSNQSNDDTIQKQIWHLKPFEFLFVIYENNRTTNIHYPFFRIKSQVPDLTVILDNESIFPIPKFECDIFNKKTQKWDVIMEPLSMDVRMKNKNEYITVFNDPINLVCSLQSLIQINHFSHKRLKYDSNNAYPHYLIENNTNEACTIKYNDNHSLTIDHYQVKDFEYKKPFEIKKFKIDPINFISPSFINDQIAVSIFSQNGKKIISINSVIQIKNKNSMKLYFQNSKNEITEIRPNGITSLKHFSPNFLINGTDEINKSEMIQFDVIKDKKKTLIDVSIDGVTYNMLLSYKFSKKKGVFMLLLRPHYKIVNQLHIPIKFSVPKMNQNLELKEQSVGYINDNGLNDDFHFLIEMNDMKSEEISFDVKKQQLIPVKFPNNNLLSIYYKDYIVIIKPPMTLKNQTKLPISMYDVNDKLIIKAEGNDDVPFGTIDYFNSDKIKLAFQISKFAKTDRFDLRDGRKEFHLKSESKQNIFYPVVLANYLGANGVFHIFVESLIKIKNKTKKQINVFPVDQSGKQCDEPISIKPNEIIPIMSVNKSYNFSVSFEKSTQNHIVSFKFNTKNNLIEENGSKIEIQTRLKFANTSYYVIFHELDDKDEIKKLNNDKQAETFSLAVQVPRFSVTVLDEKMREVFNFVLSQISYKYEPGNIDEVFNGSINDFQIDDLCPSTKVKNVLYTTVHPFVAVTIRKQTCDVQINHVVFNFDFNFVSNVLTEMMKLYKDEPDDEDDNKDDENNDAYEPAYYSLHESNEKIDYYVAPENGFITSVHQMNIKPFSFGINFTQNLRPTYHDFELESIPYLNDSVYNFVFKFNQFTMSNLNATIDELMNIFYESYYSGFILSFFNALPLNPSNILKRFNYLKSNGKIVTIDFNKIEYKDIFNSFNKQLTFIFEQKDDDVKAQNNDWIRYPRSLNYGNQIVPFDEDVSMCQFILQKEIDSFDEYFILFVKSDKKIYGISQFYFASFHKKIINNRSHLKLVKIIKLNEINSVGIAGKIITLNFSDFTNEKVTCENNDIAYKIQKVLSNQVKANIFGKRNV